MRICESCNRVKPETEDEKRDEEAKTAAARKEIQKAQAAWNAYENARPVRGFLARNPNAGLMFSMIMMSAMLGTLLWNSGFPAATINGEVAKIFFSSTAVGVLLAALFSALPEQRGIMHRSAVRNAFILCHQEEAEILGFEMYHN